LRDGGANTVRLPLLVNPSGCSTGCPNLSNDLALASQARRAGMGVVLEIEYSDTPTSSSSQPTPAAWASESPTRLGATVESYTRSVVRAFAANGTPLSRVAIGNGLSQGFLWPSGKLSFDSSDRAGWTGLTHLLRAAIAGARSASRNLPIELDTDTGADTAASVDFFDHIRGARVPFNVIGESYAPWLQGPMTALRATLTTLAARFGDPIILADEQFPYGDVTGYGVDTTAVPYPDTLPGYLISPAGQASYERDLVSLMASLPDGRGLGVFYQSPQNTGALGMFSPSGAAQPSADSFRVGSGAVLYGPDDPYATGDGTSLAIPAAQAPPATAAAMLPSLPSGLNVAIGARVDANSGSAPSTTLSNVDDGDGTTRWCPSTLGIHRVTIDLGRVEQLTGTGVTFSGEQSGDGATYTVSTGITAPGQTPLPNQASGNANAITPGAEYLFAGSSSAAGTGTVSARYVTLTYQVPREEDICVQELRAFSTQAPQAAALQRGADLSTLLSDTGPHTLNGVAEPILDIFGSGGLNYVRLRLWVNPISGNFGTPNEPPFCSASVCPDLANDLTMAKEAHAAGMKVLLDIHYSDTWADPQHQNVPAAWLGETLAQLASSVHDYTASVIQAFAAQGTPVSQVAIGNEITEGTLWNNTTLDAGASTVTPAGTKTIDVTDGEGIEPGDTLFIDSLATSNSIAGVADPSTDIVRVASVGTPGTDGTPITLDSTLLHSHTGPVSVQDVQDSGHLLFNDATGQADWNSFTTLVKAGIAGARAGNPTGNPLLVQLHIDRGGDNAAATDFVSHMIAAGVNFDVIGLSYYPWYHGPMSAMKANVESLIERFHKDVILAEDQYPQEPQQGYGISDSTDANSPDTIPGYTVDPEGQASYQRDLLSLMASMPGRLGLGVYYWDADGNGFLGQFTVGGAAQPVIDADQVSNP
jgi:arabinogalactan endo-1,4-beta-galactosidase